MALKGTFKKYDEREWNGKPFVIVEMEYKDKPWTISSFDEDIIDAVRGLEEGAEVEFETRKTKSGKHNFTRIGKTTSTGKQKKTIPPKEVREKGTDWDEIGYQKAMCGMINACLAGGLIKNLKDMDMWGEHCDRWFWKMKTHKFQAIKDARDDDNAPPHGNGDVETDEFPF